MSDNSAIEWTDATWNPVTGCAEVSPGCDRCYAKTFAERFRGVPGHHFEQGFDVVLRPERLDQPLRWRKPRRVFVNSMSDLFHEAVPDSFIHQVFAVMAATPHHTYQILTKRHGRMRSLLRDECRCGGGHVPGVHFRSEMDWVATPHSPLYVPGVTSTYHTVPYPLPNVWIGVSVEDQHWADIRIPALRDTPATVRMLSCEPLLGPLDTSAHLVPAEPAPFGSAWDRGDIGWVICGGESGPGARPMHPDWARGIRDQCFAAQVPYFFKQHGEWQPIGPLYEQHDGDEEADDARMDAVGWEVEERKRVVQLESTGHIADGHQPTDPRTWLMVRRGKRAAGRELDGRTWDDYPVSAR